jgi:hypothetical protein
MMNLPLFSHPVITPLCYQSILSRDLNDTGETVVVLLMHQAGQWALNRGQNHYYSHPVRHYPSDAGATDALTAQFKRV